MRSPCQENKELLDGIANPRLYVRTHKVPTSAQRVAAAATADNLKFIACAVLWVVAIGMWVNP